MSSVRRELVVCAVALAPFLAVGASEEPSRSLHPRNLYESFADLSEDEACSIQEHLEYVVRILGARDTTGLATELRESRALNLERLREYAARAIFPRNVRFRGDLVPHFIDGRGRACAVAHLMIESGAGDLARDIARKANFAFLPGLDDPEAERWIEESGLTPEECAMVQPQYGRWWPVRFIDMGLDHEEAQRPGPVHVTINQFASYNLEPPRGYVETIRGPVDSGRVRVDARAVLEDLPMESGVAQGVIIRWGRNDGFFSDDWELEYELDIDAGTFTFEGSALMGPRGFPTTGDSSIDVAAVPRTLGPFAAGPLETGRSIGPDCPGTLIEETASGAYSMRAHGKPIVTEHEMFEFESDGMLFAYKEVWGDFTLTATFPADGLAQGLRGLMIRESLDRRAPYVLLSERAPSRDVSLFIRQQHPEEFYRYDGPMNDPEEISEIHDPRLLGASFPSFRIQRLSGVITASVLDELGTSGEAGSWIDLEISFGAAWWSPHRVLIGVAASSEQGCGALTTATFTDVTVEEGPPPEIFRRGDVEPDGRIVITDALRILGYLFLGDAPLPCFDAADWNDDGAVNITDPAGLLGWLFVGGRAFSGEECDVDDHPEEISLPACAYPLEACK